MQVYNLPFASMTQEVGVQIGESVGKVLKVHADERGIGWGKFLRIRVEMDISKPLLRGRFITVEGKKSWVHFKYERLPTLYFKCGVIKHSQKGCPIASNDNGQNQYGVWLRAPAIKDSDIIMKRYGEGDCQPEEDSQSWRKGGEVRDEAKKGNSKSREDLQDLVLDSTVIKAYISGMVGEQIPRNIEDSIPCPCEERILEPHKEGNMPIIDAEGMCHMQVFKESDIFRDIAAEHWSKADPTAPLRASRVPLI